MATAQRGEAHRASLNATALEWMRFWQGADFETFGALHAVDFIDHSAAERPADRDGFRNGIAELYRAFPDFAATVEDLVVDEARSLVAIRWSAVGHMRGSFLGANPSGRRVSFNGIEIIAVRGGKVCERWGEWNEGALMLDTRFARIDGDLGNPETFPFPRQSL